MSGRAVLYGMMTISLPPGPPFVVEDPEPEPLLTPGPPLPPVTGLELPSGLLPELPPELLPELLPEFPPGLVPPGLVPEVPGLTLPSLVGPFCCLTT